MTPTGEHVALEHLGIAGEAGDALLDARAAAESLRPMTGAPTFIAMSMTLQIFCAWRSLKRAAEHREILREDVDQAAVDRARSGDDAVAGDLLLGPSRSRSHYARRTCHILRSCRDRAARRAARARSAGPWRAAPRCASRRRRGAPARAAFPAPRSSLPFGASSPSKAGRSVLPRAASSGQSGSSWRLLQLQQCAEFALILDQCCGTAMPSRPFIQLGNT